jgi:hypothetical protein
VTAAPRASRRPLKALELHAVLESGRFSPGRSMPSGFPNAAHPKRTPCDAYAHTSNTHAHASERVPAGFLSVTESPRRTLASTPAWVPDDSRPKVEQRAEEEEEEEEAGLEARILIVEGQL